MLSLEVNLCLIVYVRRYIDSTNLRSSELSHWSEGGTEAGRRVARASNLWEETPEARREIQSEMRYRETNTCWMLNKIYLPRPFVKVESRTNQ